MARIKLIDVIHLPKLPSTSYRVNWDLENVLENPLGELRIL